MYLKNPISQHDKSQEMKGIKGRLLKRFRSIPSIYTTSKQHVVPLYNKSQEKSEDESSQNPPNQMQQEHRTFTSLDLKEEEFDSPRLCPERRNGHIISTYHLEPTHEIDIFEECECGFDSVPEMESSSSASSPISDHCKSNDDEGDHANSKILAKIPDGCTKDLQELEQRCPPGGSDKVILYTTSLRGIRKTYEDCHAIKFLLESFRVVYFERDVSMHLGYRDELWEILGGRIIPPRLFIKGKHIGGADEVITLNELGMLQKLLQGIPVIASACSLKCSACAGVRFLLCPDCNGSCKIYKGDQGNGGNLFVKCSKCNENGLVKCPTCSQ